MARKVPSMCAIRRNTFVCHLRGIHAADSKVKCNTLDFNE